MLWTPPNSLTLRLSALTQHLSGAGSRQRRGCESGDPRAHPGNLVQKRAPGTGQLDLKYHLYVYAANVNASEAFLKIARTQSAAEAA
jgi:hypothetical protein